MILRARPIAETQNIISHRVAEKVYCKCLELMTIPDKIKLNSLNISYSRNWFAEEEDSDWVLYRFHELVFT